MFSHFSDKPGHTGNFKPQPPKFNWGGVIVILAMVVAFVGMLIYQANK
jgi:hypothetical protein